MTMKNLVLAAIATLSLGLGAAYAAPIQGQTNVGVGGPVYQRNVPANPGETRHVIGGETFYFAPGLNTGGSDGAN
jgi:hypothetical protein